MECVPFESSAGFNYSSLGQWLADAPGTVATMLKRWDLRAGDAFIGGIAGAVIAVTCSDGTAAVLKVAYPHAEGTWEAVGLQLFASGGAPAVLKQDAWTWSMLLAPVTPGVTLAAADTTPRDALVAGGRLRAALTAAESSDAQASALRASVPLLRDAMRNYAALGRAREQTQAAALDDLGVRSLVSAALDDLEHLTTTGPTGHLVHGDYNPGNILDAGDGRWVAIDPKPLDGDPAYDLWPLVSQLGDPFGAAVPAARLASQLRIAAEAAECDAVRAARWSWARAGLNVSWYLAEGQRSRAVDAAAELRAWATVVGY